MKKIYTIATIALITIVSCTDNDIEETIMHEKHNTEVLVSRTSIRDDIHNYVSHKLSTKTETRGHHDVSFDPYIYEGDTALYIVNYGNGWDIISTDQRTPMVMMSSETGQLDLNDENLPAPIKAYIRSIADEIHQLKQIDNTDNEVHPEWIKMPMNEMELLNWDNTVSINAEDEPGVGHWELIFSSQIGTPTVTESVKMTTTKWGQLDPWNYYIPYAKDTTANYIGQAGCDAVATAQYLYYLHNKTGKPTTTVSTATLTNPSKHLYSFSNKTTTAWSNMAKNSSGTTNGKRLAAMLIAFIGQKNKTEYYTHAAYSYLAKDISVINSETGEHYYHANYDYNYVINELLSNNAVLMSAKDPVSNDGHAFIADRIRTTNTTYRDYYGWVGTTKTGENANYIDESNGHIIGYKIKKEEVVTRTTYSYKMNWGYDGSYDNTIICNPYSNDDWYLTGDHLNSNRTMARK